MFVASWDSQEVEKAIAALQNAEIETQLSFGRRGLSISTSNIGSLTSTLSHSSGMTSTQTPEYQPCKAENQVRTLSPFSG